ncbi:hypothetical protein [Parafrankia discariae]|uniref:hypothetical protein n=1 Tax=Parafrankia discariae TaxID=365528 RepID=UPI00036F1835|nr:hypothetical protein [Parafrankia discariae]
MQERTESTREFHNPDGTFTTESTMGPVRFQDEKDAWVDIDTSLEQAEPGRLRAAETEHPVEVAQTATDPELGRVELGDGMSVSFSLADSASATARVDGSKATFTGVRESADLELGPYPDGLKEIIVLRSPEAPTTWELPLALEGLTARVDDRQVVLADTAGEPRAVIPPGWMEDSRTEGGTPATSSGVTYALTESEDGAQILRVDLDREWLSDPARVFPVKVDPTFNIVGQNVRAQTDDTY